MAIHFEPFSPEHRDDPYPLYRRLRDEAPVHWAPESRAFSVSRHEDVLFVLRHPELFSSRANQELLMARDTRPTSWRALRSLARFLWRTRIAPWRMARARMLIAADPPAHEALRGIVKRGFTPRRIAEWEPRIRELVERQVRPLDTGDAFDVVRDLAVPLPATVIAEMLGVESDRLEDFKAWSDTVIEIASGSARHDPMDEERVARIADLFAWMRRAVRARRRDPRDDLIGVLVDPGHGVALSETELMQFVLLLLVAGNETTTNLIGNAVDALLEHPHVLRRVAEDPARVPDLVEEALRYDSPVQLILRNATRDVEIAGVRIPEGSVVLPLLGSANRDERRFAAPDVLDPDRDTRGHVAFGFGIHFCLGAALARLEARVALEALVPRLARRTRVPHPVEWVDSFIVRGRRRLELERAAA